MSYEITKLEDSLIIKIVYLGEVTLEERMNLVHELYCDFIDCDKPKLLIDTRNSSTSMTETEQKIWGTYAASRKEQANALVAVIYNEGNELNPLAIERSKQGGRIVEIFYNESDAIKWLCEQ